MSNLIVISAHAILPLLICMDNPQFMESLFRYIGMKMIFNGTLIVQAFFLMSGLLLSYNLELMREKGTIKWTMIPKILSKRWIRLTPSYIILMTIICTWFKFIASGPLTQIAIMDEHEECNQHWWRNMLYINNFFMEERYCFPHTWYLAADFQMLIIGLVVCVLLRSSRARNWSLACLLLISMLMTPLLIYYKDLNSLFLISLKTAVYIFKTDATFTNLYTRTEGNLFNYFLGIALGWIIYRLQKNNFDLRKYEKYGFLLWLLVPVGFAVVASGIPFYSEQPRHSMYLRLLHGTLVKPAFGIVLATIIVLTIFNFEKTFKAIVEWQGWTAPSRLSYLAYLVHVTIVRVIYVNKEVLMHMSFITMLQGVVFTNVMAYTAAFPLWILIEAPFIQVYKTYTSSEELDEKQADFKKES